MPKKKVEISFYNLQLHVGMVCIEVEKLDNGWLRCAFSDPWDAEHFQFSFFDVNDEIINKLELRVHPGTVITNRIALQIWEQLQPRLNNPHSRRTRKLN